MNHNLFRAAAFLIFVILSPTILPAQGLEDDYSGASHECDDYHSHEYYRGESACDKEGNSGQNGECYSEGLMPSGQILWYAGAFCDGNICILSGGVTCKTPSGASQRGSYRFECPADWMIFAGASGGSCQTTGATEYMTCECGSTGLIGDCF